MSEPIYFVEPHGETGQAVTFVTDNGKAVFFVANKPDHNPSQTVTVNSMAALDAYSIARAFVEFWERKP